MECVSQYIRNVRLVVMIALCVFLLTMLAPSFAQIVVDFRIVGGNVSNPNYNAQFQSNNLTQASNIVSSVGQEVIVQQCGTGTYTAAGSTVCVNCPSGTASPNVGATSPLTCQTCSAGSFSATASSA